MHSALVIAAVAAALGQGVMVAPEMRPINLEIHETADSVEILVQSISASAQRASYQLAVESGGAGGATTTVQSGSLQDGAVARTLLRSRIRTAGLERWVARLKVVTPTGEYQEIRSNRP